MYELLRSVIAIIIVVIIAIGCGSSNSPTNSQSNYIGEWITRAPLPIAVQEIYPVELNGIIYVAGGFDEDSNSVNYFQAYNPSNDSWSSETAFPQNRNHINLTAVNGLIYAMGGSSGRSIQESVYAYDPSNQTWELKAPMITPRLEMTAVTFENKIYAIGGGYLAIPGGYTATNTNEMYDPITDSWTSLSPVPSSRFHLSACVLDSLIYVAGGRVNVGGNLINVRDFNAYSPESDTWYHLANLPVAKSSVSISTYNGKIYIFGGEKIQNPQAVYNTVEEYDPTTDTWQTINEMITRRHGTAAVTIADTIFVIGGANSPMYGASDVNEGFIPPQN